MDAPQTPQQPPQWPPPEAPMPASAAGGPTGPRASFGRRLAAWLVDAVMLGVVFGVLQAVLGRAAGGALNFVIGLSYVIYFEGKSGQTVGKRALGIRVIGFDTGESIGYTRALIRYVGKILAAIPCLLGYFWMLWDNENQCWQDKLANDVVVPADVYPATSWP